MKLFEIVSSLIGFLFAFGMLSAANAQENAADKVLTIVKVKAPAAVTGELIRQRFVKAIPTYQAIDGLEFKAFSLQKVGDGYEFGGIYLWKNKASAEKWFSPQWFERVKTTYGVDGDLAYYAVAADKSFITDKFNYQSETAVTIFVPNLSDKDLKEYAKKRLGLLRSYFVKTANNYAAILLFVNEQTAKLFVEKKKITNRELFQTPVLLNNINSDKK